MQQTVYDDTLAIALAEQLKSSLLQINKLAEQQDLPAEQIALISQHGLRVIDAYTLGRDQQTQLPLEPLTAGSVLYDAAELLDPLARQLGYTLQVDTQGTHRPVLTNRQALKDMLVLLATGLMQKAVENTENPQLILATHRAPQGTVVGAFSDSHELNQTAISLARRLGGQAHQLTPALSASGGAALAVAMRLSQRLETPLKARSHRGMPGVGSLLLPSKQLSLVA